MGCDHHSDTRTRTRGLDLVATYRVPMGNLGRLSLTGGLNLNKTKIRRNAAVPGALATIPGLLLFSRRESLRLTDGQPRSKINLSADYDHGWIGGTLRATRSGSVNAADADAFTDVPMSAKTITDLELRFKPMGDRFHDRAGRKQYPRRLSGQCPARSRDRSRHRAATQL